MDIEQEKILSKILTNEELDSIPPDITRKIETSIIDRFEGYLTSKALCETAKRNIDQIQDDLQKKIIELTSKIEDDDAKLQSSQQSVTELRKELEVSREDISKLLESVKKYEAETSEYRQERNIVIDERDSHLKMAERKSSEVERLQYDVSILKQQLQIAINEKCEALAKVNEIQSKEVNLEYKEKRLDQERSHFNNTIQTLNEDLNKSITELAKLRREHTLRLLTIETKLTEKTEEIKIANSTIAHLTETNNSLLLKAEDLAAKLLYHSEEVTKMMDNYKKELHAKTKLADLYQEASDDNIAQINELKSAVQELNKLLKEATDQYGELETKMKGTQLQHEQQLDEKDTIIDTLKTEIKNANDLLKVAQDENLEHAVESLAPTAAASSRLIKSGMTLTEIFSVYVKTAQELQLVKKDNTRLNSQIQGILTELEEKAPIIKKQTIDYQHLSDTNAELTQQLENMIGERVEAREEINEILAKLSYYERENKKMKTAQNDLARQVCFLLKEIEQVRGGFASDFDQSISSDMSANEVITKRLVTFSDIQELQENNEKLLLLVRDLSAKMEEMEEGTKNIDIASYESKIENYSKRVKELQDSQECQTQMMSTCMQQRDRYKKLYFECLKNMGKFVPNQLDTSLNGEDAMEEDTPLASSSSISSNESIALKEKKITELEEKILDITNQLKTLKDEYENYRKEKLTNEKMMNEQFDSMRSELREVTSTNCKLKSTAEYHSEQLKIQQNNAATYKKQISTLEDRNKNYENTIVKHEQTLMHIKDEAFSAHSKLARYEVMVENLKQECRILRDSESRLQMEREVLNRDRQSQNLLLNNLEMIKVSFERSETEGRMRMETRLDDTTRECSALRRRLQEEQDRFRELTIHLERQTETAKQKMEDEKIQANKLRIELKTARDELVAKTKQIEELSKKLQESLTPSLNDNPIAQANKCTREVELKLSDAEQEILSLQKELDTSREHVKQYCDMSQSAEKELKQLHDTYIEYKTKVEEELEKAHKNENDFRARIGDLETEISLQITGAQLNSGDASSQLHKSQTELKEVLIKNNENNRELRELRDQCRSLQANLQNVEHKYANEMMLHSTDIQAMTTLKDELLRVKEQIDEMKAARDKAITVLETSKSGWQETERKLKIENEEIEKRLINLDLQNTALHDQIQCLNTKLSITSASIISNESHDNANESMDTSLANRSIQEDDVKSSEQLLQIIKYLRKEKDIAVAKVDIIRSESVRLECEHKVLQSKLEETANALANERSKTEIGVVTAVKHEELLRKIETLNAITDSNRGLREERDNLAHQVKELSERIITVENELFPLQEKNRELTIRSETAIAENSSLRIEATRWRQRANLLVERSNKASPEDFKRLQNERENLVKMLTTEKETIKKMTEELNSIKIDKNKLDVEVSNLNKQLHSNTEENKRQNDEINTLRQANTKMTQEIVEIKNALLGKEEEFKKITEDLGGIEAQLADAKNKEIQIRKIAKRYKDSYFELKKQIEEKDGEKTEGDGQQTNSDDQPGTSKSENEKILANKMNELNAQIIAAQEENDSLKKENEQLKVCEERNKNLVKEAKTRILTLQENKNLITRDLTLAKNQLQSFEQTRDEQDLLINGLKSQYESRISRVEKEKNDLEKDNKEAINRITRENESLILRINQLNRQLGLQQGSKPSTSSGPAEKNTTDCPRTANVKPMAGPSGQQSATVTPWRGSETPLASIRPMSVQNSRTAAVLPTSQTSNVAAVQGSSSTTGSVTALVPPQQQVHTTGNNSGEAMSSSPTSSHTDYMPATSSAAVVVAAVPPMGTASTSAESSQEAESIPSQNSEPSSQIVVTGGQQQQAVALVSPRVEGGTPQNIVAPQSPQVTEQNPAPSTSGTSSSSTIQPVTISSHHQASSSSTVTTTQAGHKRPRDVEGDSSTGNVEESTDKAQQQNKRVRILVGETFQGVSESGIDVEYQVPTSSQRDQEDDIIVVDSEDDDEGMADEGTAEADDGPFDDEADNGESYEMEESYEQEQEMVNYDEIEGPDIDEDNVQSDNNEVEVDDSSEVPNQSGSSSSHSQVAPDAGTSTISMVGQSTSGNSEQTPEASTQRQSEVQQIQAISSGSEAGSSTSASLSQMHSGWRQLTPLARQQQQHSSHLMLLQQGYEETGDESIVPSTPTLYVQRRADGFSEAVSSPHPQVPHAARFTFSETRNTQSSLVPGDGMDDTRIDLSQLDESSGRSVPSTPQQVSPQERDSMLVIEQTSSSTVRQQEQQIESIAGPSSEGSVPEIILSVTFEDDDNENLDDNATTSDNPEDERDKETLEGGSIEEGEGADGVSSEGEKASGIEGVEHEEGREAEASQSPSSNTRLRSSTRGTGLNQRRLGRPTSRGNRPTPIVWQDSGRGGRNAQLNRSLDGGSPNRAPFHPQRVQRARRMRRPTGAPFGNMRY